MKLSIIHKILIYNSLILLLCTNHTPHNFSNNYITNKKKHNYFTLSENERSTPLCLSSLDFQGVQHVSKLFQMDIKRVTDNKPEIYFDTIPMLSDVVIIGTMNKNPIIDQFIRTKKIDIEKIKDKRETFLIQAIKHPHSKDSQALVIVGSDKRGTIYGIFELSKLMGVSPWYWWADVPVKKKSNIYISPEPFTLGEPKVKYRGIFINDEAPALSGWVYENYGGFNSQFYEKVFELILRLRGNFLWPAMWGRAFYDDDSENPKLANEYGIVISTSHHEPMMRAHDEWRRYGSGPWNYNKNGEQLREFWREGITRMEEYESIVTLAMRGDGDEPMSEEADIELLQTIVKDQREILTEITGKKIEKIPQVWALYKEVQMYYDKGMRVPEDVTLLLCDDNWGNIRKLPQPGEKSRKGGYGIYYHYDYVGDPRNYKWLNTTQISRVWEQMNLAYQYGTKEIWIVNVGDIKPMEFPISFFLDFAWDPEKISAQSVPEYIESWSAQQFGMEYAKEIADILTQYTRFNSRRKPELLSPETYSLIHFNEAERILNDYRNLEKKARNLYKKLPDIYKDAFYQLVLHPVEACANLNDLYITASKNHLYAKQERASTNDYADKVQNLFNRDAEITRYYNLTLANGKWNHFMDQTHIGYTYWQQPDQNNIPATERITIRKQPEMGISIEGSENDWPTSNNKTILPELDPVNKKSTYLEIFNKGTKPFNYEIQIKDVWIIIDHSKGTIEKESRIPISIDWTKAPNGETNSQIIIKGTGHDIPILIRTHNFSNSLHKMENCFIESNGYISIEAEHYQKLKNSASYTWEKIPNLGRTLSAITPQPNTFENLHPSESGAFIEYQCYFFNKEEITINTYLSPSLNFHNTEGLRYGISIDKEKPQIINIHKNKNHVDWQESVRNNVTIGLSKHKVDEPGKHSIKIWAIDPGIVIQKIIVDTGDMKPSYLGPPESYNSAFK